ncbi:MAG TPA: hypothetical protein VKR55_05825 [Bradyrhizobium sp.]|uniref:hypothetical protein n=1 Tax=Bradyrhizobium sp. TaxID=376 RepID=UPI002BB55AA9|nr:hypothetical protein [Bradyrhizobium sp.]HLZ01659.1 hypothetical protein [Bradyrhizobium sp.]
MPTEAGRGLKPGSFSFVRTAGLVARTIVILLLAVLTAIVASPQMERLSTLLDTPSDLVRIMLGFAVCVWCVINLFILPKDTEAYRNWLYLGAVLVPLAVLCTIVVW